MAAWAPPLTVIVATGVAPAGTAVEFRLSIVTPAGAKLVVSPETNG